MIDDAHELMNAARYLPHGPTRIAAYERAIAAADADHDVDAGFRAREQHLQACAFGGAADRGIVSFAWCLARHDEEPDRFNNMLWQYKWITVALPEFASVSRAQIAESIDDMQRRYEQTAKSPVPVAKVRWRVALTMGELELAETWRLEWLRLDHMSGRQAMTDCPACDAAEHANMMALTGRDAEALKLAEPILEGHRRCAEVPHFTLGEMLGPLVRSGRTDEAADTSRRGYEMVRRNPEFLSVIALHVDFRRLHHDPTEAMEMAVRHWGWLETVRSDARAAAFLLAATRAIRAHLAKPRVRDRRKLRLPVAVGIDRDASGAVSLTELAGWSDGEQLRISRALDERNGNSYYVDLRTVDRGA